MKISYRILYAICFAFCLDSSLNAQLLISEFMAENSGTLVDEDGDESDWVEIRNSGQSAVDLGGWYLTDNVLELDKWRVPSVQLASESYMLVFASGKDRRIPDSELHTNFGLDFDGEYLALVRPDGETVEYEFSPSYPRQRADISYGILTESGVANYFDEPTPGAPNSTGFVDLVTDTQFSVDRGFYETAQQVEISTLTAGAQIRYTLNGDPPTAATGIVYTGAIDISATTTLRAAAFKPGFLPTNVDTQTYIFLSDVVRQDYQATLDAGFPPSWGGTSPDYGMDPDVIGFTGGDRYGGKYRATILDDLKALPSLCISMNVADLFGSNGIYTNSRSRGSAWERACSVELIRPDGSEGFQQNCGIRIQGGAFRSHGLTKKHSFRLLFKGIYGPTKLRYPLFGEDGNVAKKFDTVTLRSNSNDGWQWGSANGQPLYVRDSFGRETVLDMGNISSHETFVHLYLNGIYWGLYNPLERPDASFSAHYFGGDKDDWDAYSNSSVSSGSSAAWNQMINLSGQGLASDADYQAIQGNFPDGSPDPSRENYVDVGNLIDYMISNLYGGNSDWPHKNYWGTRQRGSESTGYKFHMWDSEWSLGLRSNLGTNRTGVDNGIATAYGAMRANAEFQQRFGDRLQQVFFKGGALYVDPSSPAWNPDQPERNRPAARFMRLCDTVERALVAESARWGDQHASTPYTVDEHWTVERDGLLEDYFPARSARVLSQFRGAGLYPAIDAPAFNQHGGFVDPDFVLFATAAIGTVYYTVDGSDPRLPGGNLSASALEGGSATGFTILRSGAPVRVLVPTSDIGTAWTEEDFDDGAWSSGVTGVGYERNSGYEDLIGVDVEDEMYNESTSVYMRVAFDLDEADGLALLSLRMKYDDGFVAYLNGVRVASRNAPASPTWTSGSTSNNSDSAAVVFETIDITGFADQLRVGSNVLAIHGLNTNLGSSDLIMLPELLAAQVGEAEGIALGTGTTHIRARALDGLEWSALNEATFVSGGPLLLRVTEIMYHPPDPIGGAYSGDEFEYLEIRNIGSQPIQLIGVSFRGAVTFDFDDSSVDAIDPGDFLVVVENIDAFAERYDAKAILIAGEYAGRLANGGERVQLVGPVGETIQEFSYSDLWYPVTDGLGFSLVIDDALGGLELWDQAIGWRPSGEIFGSPGVVDSDDGVQRGLQLPGDANQDGQLDLSDGVSLLLRLFSGGAPPLPCDGTLEEGGNLSVFDVNGDMRVNLSDAVYTLAYLFQGGSAPVTGTQCVRTEGCPGVCSF